MPDASDPSPNTNPADDLTRTFITRRSAIKASATVLTGSLIAYGVYSTQTDTPSSTATTTSTPTTPPQPTVTPGAWTSTHHLTAASVPAMANFGGAVALTTDYALVGALYDGADQPTDAGAAYRFTFDGTDWTQTQRLTANDPTPDKLFGNAVALTNTHALIGALSDDTVAPRAGAAYIFTVTDGDWRQTQKITPELPRERDYFGQDVALAGNHALIGAPGRGAAFLFTFDGSRWQRTHQLTVPDAPLGHAVALDKGRAVVGAPWDDEYGSRAGAAYVFTHSNGQWEPTQKLTAPNPTADAFFGTAVAIADDRILIGAAMDYEDATEAGATYLFKFDGTQWTHTTHYTGTKLFGSTVALTPPYAFVGAYDSGTVTVFRLTDSEWTQAQSVALGHGFFGSDIALTTDRALIGANSVDTTAPSAGAAYIFTRYPTTTR